MAYLTTIQSRLQHISYIFGRGHCLCLFSFCHRSELVTKLLVTISTLGRGMVCLLVEKTVTAQHSHGMLIFAAVRIHSRSDTQRDPTSGELFTPIQEGEGWSPCPQCRQQVGASAASSKGREASGAGQASQLPYRQGRQRRGGW